jgi:hypothetical protein
MRRRPARRIYWIGESRGLGKIAPDGVNRPAKPGGGIMDNPKEMEVLLREKLHADESLVWWQQPIPEIYARFTWPTVIAGVIWTAFSIVWIIIAIRSVVVGGQAGVGPLVVFDPLLGLPFVAIGAWMMTSRRRAFLRSQKTCYALTNKRVIILSVGRLGSASTRSFGPADVRGMLVRELADGSGIIIFGPAQLESRVQFRQFAQRTFLGVWDVQEVANLIRQTLHS